MISEFMPIAETFAKKIRLLIVDDDSCVLSTTVDMFPSELFDITTASSAAEAENVIRSASKKWHCWILDIAMEEEESGIRLLRAHSGFPFVIMLSGMHSMSIASRAMQLGAFRVFDKDPSSFDLLQHEVCRLAVMGFLLNGTQSKYFSIYEQLSRKTLQNTEEWAKSAAMTERQLERICQLHSPLTPKYQLSLFYALHSLLLVDDNPGILEPVKGHLDFVMKYLEKTYIPWLRDRRGS